MELKKDYSETLRRQLVGVKLKAWRQSANLSQGETAKLLNYSSPQFISNWERGIAMPPMEVLPKLVHLYKISPKELTDTIYNYQEKLLAHQRKELTTLLKASLSDLS